MATKCIHCKAAAVPVYDFRSEKFKPLVTVCSDCFNDPAKEHHEWPYNYTKVFDKNGWAFQPIHPTTPKAFTQTTVGKMPQVLQDAVNAYDPTKSYLLHGVTGSCKTRAAWLMFNKGWLHHYPKDSHFLTMRSLEQAIEDGFENRTHGKVLDKFISCAVLVLDDLGKERLTQRMESDLFAIIDERTSNLRPTIITTNYNGQGLNDRFSNTETGAAIIRRLKDYFVICGTA